MAKFQVEYECVHETFQMEGNNTVTCLYSGEWYKIPKCLKRKREKSNKSNLNPLNIVIPLLIAPFCIFYNYIHSKKICLQRKEITPVEEKQGM